MCRTVLRTAPPYSEMGQLVGLRSGAPCASSSRELLKLATPTHSMNVEPYRWGHRLVSYRVPLEATTLKVCPICEELGVPTGAGANEERVHMLRVVYDTRPKYPVVMAKSYC